jgi:hypothetical protein
MNGINREALEAAIVDQDGTVVDGYTKYGPFFVREDIANDRAKFTEAAEALLDVTKLENAQNRSLNKIPQAMYGLNRLRGRDQYLYPGF